MANYNGRRRPQGNKRREQRREQIQIVRAIQARKELDARTKEAVK